MVFISHCYHESLRAERFYWNTVYYYDYYSLLLLLLCYFAVYYSNVGNDTQCWIGLYKSVPERSDASTYWLDGNPSKYRNWRNGEPNTKHQCILIYNSEFRDGPCSVSRRYVCKGIYNFCLIVIFRYFLVLVEVDSVSFDFWAHVKFVLRRLTVQQLVRSLCVINHIRLQGVGKGLSTLATNCCRFPQQFVAVFGNKVSVSGNNLLPKMATKLPVWTGLKTSLHVKCE